jgi:hypothetical protein
MNQLDGIIHYAMNKMEASIMKEGILTIFEFDKILQEYNCPIDIKQEFLQLMPKEYWGSLDWFGVYFERRELSAGLKCAAWKCEDDEGRENKFELLQWAEKMGIFYEEEVKNITNEITAVIKSRNQECHDFYWEKKKILIEEQEVCRQQEFSELKKWFEQVEIGTQELDEFDQILFNMNEEQIHRLLRDTDYNCMLLSLFVMPKKLIHKVLDSLILKMQYLYLKDLYIAVQDDVCSIKEYWECKEMIANLYRKYEEYYLQGRDRN